MAASLTSCTQHYGLVATSIIFLPLLSVTTAAAGVTLIPVTVVPAPPKNTSIVTVVAVGVSKLEY